MARVIHRIRMEYHRPVLLKECIEGLSIDPEGVYVDVTFGGGGHSREILKNLNGGKLYGFDQDDDAVVNKIEDSRFVFVKQNFRYVKKFLKFYGNMQVDGLLADLGISSHQIDEASRGFSIRFDAELDMRMDQSARVSAAEVINEYAAGDLQRIFSEYGEIINSKTLAQLIVKKREEGEIKTIGRLKDVIEPVVAKANANQYYAQVFQALRIEVNDELGALKEMLLQSAEVIKKGGRLVVISYHSLEDRLVKNFISKGKFEGEVEKDIYGNPVEKIPFKAVNKKPIVASLEELKENPRSRSAKLRIAERI